MHRTLSTLVLLMPMLCRALLIREMIFSDSFGLSLNPVSWVNSKVRSSMAATGVEEDFFLLALVFGFRWTVFQPSGAGEAATEAKDCMHVCVVDYIYPAICIPTDHDSCSAKL